MISEWYGGRFWCVQSGMGQSLMGLGWYEGRFWWVQSGMKADSSGFTVVWKPIVVVF